MKSAFFLFLVAASPAVHSQIIIVLDQNSGRAIPGVAFVSHVPSASATTDMGGNVEISEFRGADSIFVTHVGYTTRLISFRQLAGMDTLVLVEKIIPLREVVVSASRYEEALREVPHRVERIRTDQIALQNPQTAADLLGTNGFVYVQKSQLAGGSPMLRGFAANRVLLVIDGVRMNNAIFRSGNLQNAISLDAAAVQSAEILFGPGAVLYGSDAIGGVMDFVTAEPDFSEQGVVFSGNAFTRFSSANSEKSAHIDLAVKLPSLASLTSFTYSDFGDLRAGSNGNPAFLRPTYQERIAGVDLQFVNPDPQIQVHSGYRQTNFTQKLRFEPDPAWEVRYSFHYSATSDAPRYDRLYLDADNDGILDFAQWYYGPQRWLMNRIGISRSNPNPFYDHFRLVGAIQNYEESRHDRRTGAIRLRNQTEAVDAFSLNFDVKKQAGEKTLFFYGAEAVRNNVGSHAGRIRIDNGDSEPTTTRYPDGSVWQSHGTYARVKHFVNPQWSISAGIRFTYHAMEADFDTSRFPFPFSRTQNSSSALNGSAGVVFNPAEQWHFYANISTGFRAPNIDDIGKVFESEPGSIVVPNPDLGPEYAYSAELGATGAFGEFLEVNLSTYYTYLTDALARRGFSYNGQDSILYDGQLSRIQAIQNITSAYVYGFQAAIFLRLGAGATLKSTYSYQAGWEQSKDDLEYYPLRHAAPAFGATHVLYERGGFTIDLYALYNEAMDHDELALTERGDPAPYAKDRNGNPFVPAWHTLNAKASFSVNKHLSVNIGLENITDQLYRPYASGISAPGRNFLFALRGNF